MPTLLRFGAKLTKASHISTSQISHCCVRILLRGDHTSMTKWLNPRYGPSYRPLSPQHVKEKCFSPARRCQLGIVCFKTHVKSCSSAEATFNSQAKNLAPKLPTKHQFLLTSQLQLHPEGLNYWKRALFQKM